MKITYRRIVAGVATPMLALGMLATTPTSAQAAPNSNAYSAARWLEDQLVGDLAPSQYGGSDYGLSVDVFFTLKDLDTRAGAQADIIDALAVHVGDYTTGEAFGDAGSRYAGATGKLTSAVQAAGRDATSFGGENLVTALEGVVAASGRASDVSTYGDYSNTIGQSWVVRGLEGADSAKTAAATEYLLKQQCSTGGFRGSMSDTQCATPGANDDISLDATALATRALLQVDTAQSEAAARKAVAFLISKQAKNGSFVDNGTANTNTTGLVAATLARVGKTVPASKAASWIIGRQVTDAVGADSALENEIGAIAYDTAALTAGKSAGITAGANRDQWIRASAQAATGVNALLRAKKFSVSTPAAFVRGGTKTTIKVTGLEAGEPYTATGAVKKTGTAPVSGNVSLSYTAPKKTTRVSVKVVGLRANRVGTGTIKVLGAKKLPLKVSKTSVAAGGAVTVSISGLSSGEPASVTWRGTTRKLTANASGKVAYRLNVGSKKGTSKVSVTGAFADRKNAASLRVK